jgi:hypothetical protein|tara:strand:- start:298 stop:2781 length:2484 start_codon:yes stop_codon:yes gene_type:complete
MTQLKTAMTHPLLFTMALALTAHANPTLVINEFAAINDSGLQDEDGDHSDWLELHNYGEQPVDLSGAWLTDNRKKPMLWKIPAVSLAPGGYLVIFLSGKDRSDANTPLHSNFALKGKGGYLGLFASNGLTIIHEFVAYPGQKRDISYGLSAAGRESPLDAKHFFGEPTPGASNGKSITGVAGGVKFSVKRGWHDKPFELRLTTKTGGAQIRYTLDGTSPKEDNGNLYGSPLTIDSTTTVRATAFKPSFKPSSPTTRTFLFVNDIIRQSPDGLPPESFPYNWGENKVDYGMDSRIVDDPRYSKELIAGFRSLPSFSVVMNLDDLFDRKSGIYANAEWDGRESERPCSVEFIQPDGSKGFQIDCGIRIRGGFSRRSYNPKHSFRLFFRDTYGPSKLDFPLFGNTGARTFDNFDLRTFQNYSWHIGDKDRAIFLRDQFNRDLQLAMGQPAARGEFCHLFINGQYWGLYNTCERIKASFGKSYFGGKKEEYDSIKKGRTYLKDRNRSVGVMANDGNLDAWERLWKQAKAGLRTNEAYFKMLGRNADGSDNPDYECLLDVDNLIDYMLVIFYAGNYDAPVSAWGQNFGPNNWYGIRNRNSRDGFRFFAWDAEHTFRDVREDRTGPFPAGESYSGSNPQWIWQQCLENQEFRVRAGDRIQKYFFDNGVLAAKSVQRRFLARARSIESAVVCESARWGDSSHTPSGGTASRGRRPRNRDDDWIHEINRLAHEYFPARSEIVLAQLYGHGIISDVPSPEFKRVSDNSQSIQITPRQGKVYYTTDGSDPRRIGGAVAPEAKLHEEGTIQLTLDVTLNARVRYRNEWSALLTIDGTE